MFWTVLLRILLFLSFAIMVFDYLRVEQLFIQMERGFINEFSVQIIEWPGYVFITIFLFFLLMNIVQYTKAYRNKHTQLKAMLTPEYDVSDERNLENTRKATSIAFVFMLTYSFLALGSYMLVPNYFVDFIWYPLAITASIPIIGLASYYISYKTFEYR